MKKHLNIFSITLMRYSIVILLFWYGIIKFSSVNASNLNELIKYNPILKYAYNIFSLRATANIIGSIEIITAIFIALQPFTNKIGKIGAVLGMIIFANTLFFFFTSSNIWKMQAGILLPVSFGSFIFKDIICFAFCLFSIVNDTSKKKK